MLLNNMIKTMIDNYLRQGGFVFVVICLSVCLSVSNFAQKLPNGREIFREG